MPSDHALKRTHDHETMVIHAADLYLLGITRKSLNMRLSDTLLGLSARINGKMTVPAWTVHSALLSLASSESLDRAAGCYCSKPYIERLKQISRNKEDITEDEKILLGRIRSASDRQGVSYTRLVRTFYGEGFENLAELISEAGYDGKVFDDAALYDAVSTHGLHSLHNIMTRIPQIVVETPSFAAWYNERKRKAQDEAMKVGVEQFNYALSIFRLVAKWSHILIYDKEANDGPGNVLLVYLDSRGRVLRYSRLDRAEDLQAADGMFCSGQDSKHAWWAYSRYGEDWEPRELSKRWDVVDHEKPGLET